MNLQYIRLYQLKLFENFTFVKVDIFDKVFESIKPCDVQATFASTDTLEKAEGFKTKRFTEVCMLVCSVL